MFKNMTKKELRILIILCAALVVAFALLITITALISDEGRLSYELQADGTYEVTDVKNTYRGGWFAKDTIVVPATHKGVAVTSINKLNLQKTQNVEIPEGITTIKSNAFYGTSIVSVKLPTTVTSIGSNAFSGCVNLTEINIPNITTLADGIFSNCTSLTGINIPESVTKIGNEAFSGCTKLASLTIPDGVTSLGNSAFSGCTELVSLTIPDGVTSLGNSAFSGCTQLKSLVLSANLTSIGTTAFDGCEKLEYNEYQDGFYLGSNANSYAVLVYAKENVTTFEINGSTKIIYDLALSGQTELKTVSIPQSVLTIGNKVFSNCTKLTTVSIPQSVTSIAKNAFDRCEKLESISVAADNANYSSVDGILYNKSKTEFVAVPLSVTSANIPSTITAIPANTFANCAKLTTVTIPSSVKSIGAKAFIGCANLTSVIFENTDNWKADTMALGARDLADAQTAATLLIKTHVDKTWTREEK